MFLIYLAVVALIAYWPSPVDKPMAGQLYGMFAFLHRYGVPAWCDYALVESASNAALLVPFGFLMTMCFPANRWWLNIAVGFLASSAMELGQLLYLSQRFPSILDVAANTAGTAVGVAISIRYTRNRGRTGTQKAARSQ